VLYGCSIPCNAARRKIISRRESNAVQCYSYLPIPQLSGSPIFRRCHCMRQCAIKLSDKIVQCPHTPITDVLKMTAKAEAAKTED